MSRSSEALAVSVIVCTRDRAAYLDDCLKSLSQQQCDEPFEIVVIDNGSSDNTQQVIAARQTTNPRLRSYREARVGLSIAKNTGARQARGRLLLFTDDDVIVQPGWIQAYLNLFRRLGSQDAIAGGPIRPISNDLKSWPKWFDQRGLFELGMLDFQTERPLRKGEYVWGANMALPAEVFWKIGPWDENLGNQGNRRDTFEDTEYQDRLAAAGGTVWFCPGAALQHRIGSERLHPRYLMQAAFARGRNAFCQEVIHAHKSMDNAPRNALVGTLGVLAVNLTTWLIWTVIFQFWRSREAFRQSRESAFRSGWNMERVRAGRQGPYIQALIRVIWTWRGLVLRLT